MSGFEDDEQGAGEDDELERPAAPQRSRKRKPDSRRSHSRGASLELRLRESLEAVADWLLDRGDAELGGTLRDDAPKMARFCSRLAGTNPIAKKAVTVVADALEPVRAFGPTLRILWRRVLERRARRLEEFEEPEEEELVTEPVHVAAGQPPEHAEPWRIREG